MRGEVLTPWTQIIEPETGEVANVPLLWTVRPHGRVIDVTEQSALNLIPNPNMAVVEWEAEAEDFASIDGDERFHVLWSEA